MNITPTWLVPVYIPESMSSGSIFSIPLMAMEMTFVFALAVSLSRSSLSHVPPEEKQQPKQEETTTRGNGTSLDQGDGGILQSTT